MQDVDRGGTSRSHFNYESDEEWWDSGMRRRFYHCEQLKVLTWHCGSLKVDVNKEEDCGAAIPWTPAESKPHHLGATVPKISEAFCLIRCSKPQNSLENKFSSANMGKAGGLLCCFKTHFLNSVNNGSIYSMSWKNKKTKTLSLLSHWLNPLPVYSDGQSIWSLKRRPAQTCKKPTLSH